MKVLVTGSSGVAGQGLKSVASDYPQMDYIFSTSRDCDLTDLSSTKKYFNKIRPDVVIHLAAKSGGIGLSIKHPATLLFENVIMNLSVLEAAKDTGVKKIVMTLSSGMYPPDATLPLNEDSIHSGVPHHSNSGYSFAKRLVEPAITAYKQEYGLCSIGLIPNGIFGENDNFSDDAPMLPSLIRRFYENKNTKENIVIWGDGSPLREWTYSKDLARAFMWCVENYSDTQVLNIGNTEEYSVKDIALMIAEIMGIASDRIDFDTSKSSGVYRKSTDNSRFINLSNFKYTSFKSGLEKTIEWFAFSYENNPEIIRMSKKS